MSGVKKDGLENIDTDELARFREEWKDEVRHKTTTNNLASSSSTAPAKRPVALTPNPWKSALDLYRLAVQNEQEGRLDDAVSLYRSAFQRDANVDRAFRRELLDNQAHVPADNDTEQKQQPLPIPETPIAIHITEGSSFAQLLKDFPHWVAFASEDERQHAPLETLPDELMIHMLLPLARTRDITSLERFAGVCRKARIITLDSAIWRHLVETTYIYPQLPRGLSAMTLAKSYGADYRRTYIEHPRIRCDGVYIAVCHYVRPGLSENAWINIAHVVTYHRYLRFFPDGMVISLLANDQHKHADIIPLLRPSLRMEALFIGTWILAGTNTEPKVELRELQDPSGKTTKYGFQMDLKLRSKPRGRWNKLDIEVYESVDAATREVSPFSLKHERSFWFSKVKSYRPEAK